MFSFTGLDPDQTKRLVEEYSIYLTCGYGEATGSAPSLPIRYLHSQRSHFHGWPQPQQYRDVCQGGRRGCSGVQVERREVQIGEVRLVQRVLRSTSCITLPHFRDNLVKAADYPHALVWQTFFVL